MNIIEAKNITKTFGRAVVVDDVSFSAEKGEVLGLVGESGSGKTTLARIMLGLLRPEGGQVLFEGNDVFSKNNKELKEFRKAAQIIFQDPVASLDPRMRAGDIIKEPMLVHGAENNKDLDEEVTQLLKLGGLGPHYRSRFPHEVSGGEAQRIAVAKAVSLGPRLLIADEAVSSLDEEVQSQIIDLLMDLKKKLDLTIIFIAHDLILSKKICDRICVMKSGRIIEKDQTSNLFSSPKETYTKQLLSDSL